MAVVVVVVVGACEGERPSGGRKVKVLAGVVGRRVSAVDWRDWFV